MKRIWFIALATALAVLMPSVLYGQKSTMTFEHEVWDFGRIEETGGQVEHVFTFTNTGKTPFVVEHISISCGCTTPEFTRQPIKPGDKGTIKIMYNPENRPGVFKQNIYIRSNGGANNNTIRIEGEVVPRVRSVAEEYPFSTRSGLRFNTMSANFHYVEQGAARSKVIGYANPTDKPIKFAFDISPATDNIKVAAPEVICAGCRGEITITYDLKPGTYGRFIDRVYPVVDGVRETLPFSLTAMGVDKMRVDDENAVPRADITPGFFNFGDVKAGRSLTQSFLLHNRGRQPLVVRWSGYRHFMHSTLADGTVVEAGRSVGFDVTMDTTGAPRGTMTGTVSFITNDPIRPMREIRLSANVL